MSPELEAIAQRLDELEKQVAHLEALITEQSDPDKVVTARTFVARSFVVKDEKWQGRAELGMTIPTGQTDAQPYLGLSDASKRIRACIHVDTEGPSLELFNAKGQEVAEVREFQDGPRVALFDANGNNRLSLKVSEGGASEGGSFAYLFSPNGKQHLRLELFSTGQASLVIQDASGDPRALLVVSKSREASLALLKDNNVAWIAP